MITTNRKPHRRVRGRSQAAVAAPPARVLYVVSDSTGNLARHMVSAYLTQFDPGAVAVRYETFVRDTHRLTKLLAQAAAERAAVCHAVVFPDMKRAIIDGCRRHRLACHDLTGAGVAFLSRVAGRPARPDVAALHPIDGAYRRRIGAIEFTLAHDDGLGLDTIDEADVVLTGVSRTSKTPTSILLAQQGYRAANVPLAPGVGPPPQLLALPAARVVGLVIEPPQLIAIRSRRQQAWRTNVNGYGDPEKVVEELEWSRRLFARQGWPILDVTDHAVEETAAQVIATLRLPSPADETRPPGAWDDLPPA